MGKKTARKKRAPIDTRMPPTAEQARQGEYLSAGMAYKRTAAIDTLLKRGQINDVEYRNLAYYRDQAGLADRSATKSCLDIRVRGGTSELHISASLTSAILTTARIERDLGSLVDIARAIAVNDLSLTQWCIDRHGGRERYDGKGRFVSMVPNREREVMSIALLELRMAARRIVS